jgi:hypothetical protein
MCCCDTEHFTLLLKLIFKSLHLGAYKSKSYI